MNILYIHTHDSGRFFRHYGYGDAPTERISRWALEGALSFRRAYCACPTCSPSRASLLTGRYPHSNGMLGLAHRGFSLNNYEEHTVRLLRAEGYHTALCGVQHEGAGCFESRKGAERIGYDEDITAPLEGDHVSGDTTAAWDRSNAEGAAAWVSREHRTPFFLSFGLYSTHREYPAVKTVDADCVLPPRHIYDNPGSRRDHAGFLESLKVVDECFHTVMTALEGSPHRDNTLVLFTTDHGMALPFTKCTLNDAGMGVALMMKVPGFRFKRPFTEALVSQVDVLPTLCDLLGLKKPEHLQGNSFLPVLKDPRRPFREHIYGEVNFHTSYEPLRSVRSERYSYVRYFDPENPVIRLSNMDNSDPKNLLLHHGIASKKKREFELYDLYFDPQEKNNLADDPAYRPVREEMDRLLREWQIRTGDPLLKGPLEAEEGTVVNKPDCLEPDSEDPGDYL